MQINLNTSLYEFNQNREYPSFQSRAAIKFLERVKTAKELKYVKATFDEVVRAYNELGYDVFHKRGSHAVIVISDNVRLSLVHPHGKKKGLVTPTEIKKLRYVAQGEIEKAVAME